MGACGADEVGRRDDGTLTIRDPLVKAVAVDFCPDSTELAKAIRPFMSAMPPIATARCKRLGGQNFAARIDPPSVSAAQSMSASLRTNSRTSRHVCLVP